MNNKERAMQLACQAYQEMVNAGISDEFTTLLSSIYRANRGTFFGSFGDDTGCFIEFQNIDDDILSPMRLCFGIRRHRQKLHTRIWSAVREAWFILVGHDTEYVIDLDGKNLTKLKDLLLMMK